MSKAQAAGIDAFGLDIAYGDPNVPNIVAMAFNATQTMSGRTIQLFLIFDYAAWGAWDENSVISYINQYKSSSAYFTYNSKPVVSTFEGTGNTGDWTAIKSATGCFAIPEWSSLGVSGALSASSNVDGLASWGAWPEGPANLTTSDDQTYMSGLNGRPYMMPVSPWFYTNLPQYSKNWLWHSDSIWHYRWLQAISLAPTFIQIISWNDYGESHYIGPIRPSGVVSGAWYVDSAHAHTGWTAFLPHYIAAYKAGSTASLSNPPSTALDNGKERLVYWYKTNPIASGSADGTTGDNTAYQPYYAPGALSPDTLFFTVLLKSPANISVSVGSNTAQTVLSGSTGINHFSVPLLSGQTGTPQFWVMRGTSIALIVQGSTPITSTGLDNGNVNWNPVVGSSS